MQRGIKAGFVIGFIGLVAISAWDIFFILNSAKVSGEVVDRRQNRGDTAGDHMVAEYEHPADGYTYRAPLGTGMDGKPEIGTEVDLRVHEQHVKNVKLDTTGSLYGRTLPVLVVAVLGSLLGGMMLVRERA